MRKIYIKFNSNGGIGKMVDQEIAVGEKVKLNAFTKEKCIFLEWSNKSHAEV